MADIIKKAPSSRAYVNYGLTFMRRGQYEDALQVLSAGAGAGAQLAHHSHQSGYRISAARQLGHGPLSPGPGPCRPSSISAQALAYRGEYFLKCKDYAAARRDFETSIPLSREMLAIYKGIATASAGLE